MVQPGTRTFRGGSRFFFLSLFFFHLFSSSFPLFFFFFLLPFFFFSVIASFLFPPFPGFCFAADLSEYVARLACLLVSPEDQLTEGSLRTKQPREPGERT